MRPTLELGRAVGDAMRPTLELGRAVGDAMRPTLAPGTAVGLRNILVALLPLNIFVALLPLNIFVALLPLNIWVRLDILGRECMTLPTLGIERMTLPVGMLPADKGRVKATVVVKEKQIAAIAFDEYFMNGTPGKFSIERLVNARIACTLVQSVANGK